MPKPLRVLMALDAPQPRYDEDHEPEADTGGVQEPVSRPRPARQGAATAWEPVHESRRQAAGRKVGMVVLWCAVLLLMFLGLRSLFGGGGNTTPTTAAATSSFPAGDARAVATRFVTNYLTLPDGNDQKALNQRKSALSQDTPLDLSETWNGQGSQRVVTVLPGDVRAGATGGQQVTLLVQLVSAESAQPSPSPAASPSSTPTDTRSPSPSSTPAPTTQSPTSTSTTPQPMWVTVVVPVQSTGGRVVVAGAPAFTSNPGAGQVRPPASEPSTDSGLTNQTRATAQAFFQAWAGNDPAALAAAAAPGSKVAPLGSGIEFAQLTEWRVFSGSDAHKAASSTTSSTTPASATTQERTGRASVAWRLPSGATFTQTYRVRLQAVTGSGITDWRVADATATQ